MKPICKWQGGKRRELPTIKPYIPDDTILIAEPFCGGAAVSFDFEGTAHLNDTNENLINLYRVIADKDLFQRLLDDIVKLKTATSEQREKIYYQSRKIINAPDFVNNSYKTALAFLIVRQQCFSGMERYNNSGEFNVPWGRYKTFSCTLTEKHHEFLQFANLTNLHAIDFLKQLSASTFVFVDPPYLDRAGYENKDGGLKLHADLAVRLKANDFPFLLIHSDNDFYRDIYAEFSITEVPFKYGQQWTKGEYDRSVTHLYISNAMAT